MKHRCDTCKDCGDSTCRHAKSHGECWRSRGPTKCSTADYLVRCNPIVPTRTVTDEWTPGKRQVTVRCSQLSEAELCLLNGMPCNVATDGIICAFHHLETHTCYFCDHTGQDVNRIDRLAVNAVGGDEHIYCCDDAVACDHRWSGENDRLERGIRRAINGELFMHSLLGAESRHKLSDVITARVMELVNEPLS